MSQTIPESIALIDFLHMLTVNVKQVLSDPSADPSAAVGRTMSQLAAVRSSCAHTIVCLDSPPYWRKQIYHEYKGKRAEREPEWKPLLDATLERVHLDGYNVARAPTQEADDVAATLAHIYSTEYGCGDVRIVGADKDALQCVSESVRCFVPKERGEFDIRGVEWLKKELDVAPADFPLLLAIMGDTSDNIPGIKGLGKGHGAKLINIYKTPEGIALGLVAAQQDAALTGKPLAAVWKNWAAGMAQLPLWLALTTLRTDVEFDVHPLKFLEYVAPQPIAKPLPPAPAEDVSDADDSEFYQDAGEPTAEELEAERLAMAASLPVDPAPAARQDADLNEKRSAADRQVAAARAMSEPAVGMSVPGMAGGVTFAKPIIGKDPKADAALKQLAAEQERQRIEKMAADARERVASGQTDPKTGKPPVPKASAGESGTATATPAASVTAVPAAEVVPQTQGPAKQSSALAVAPPRWELQVQPKSVEGMMWMAERLHNARVFSAFGSVEGTFGIIAFGRELGMGVMQSLMSFVPVKDKPFMWAHAMRGRVLASPVCEYLINTESTSERSTWITRRVGWPAGVQSSYTFTFEEAQHIGLTTGSNRDNWLKNPRSMIDKTASSRLIRQVYADVLLGIHSIEESA